MICQHLALLSEDKKKTCFDAEAIGVLGQLAELVRGEIDTGCSATDRRQFTIGGVYKTVHLREVVDHHWDRRLVEDRPEESQDSRSVLTHCKSKVACEKSAQLVSYSSREQSGENGVIFTYLGK